MLDAKNVKRQESERKRLQAFVDRFKAKASKARQAQSRMKMLERMKPIAALVDTGGARDQLSRAGKELSPPIIAVDNVSVGYEPDKPVLSRVTLRIDNDDRIALLGANGNGKSTLVKLLAGRLKPFSGAVTRAEKLDDRLFRPASARRIERGCLHLRSRAQADAGGAGIEGARPRRSDRLFRQGGRHAGGETLRRREGAAAAGTCDLLRPAT